MLKMMNLEGNFLVQNKIIKHFILLIDEVIESTKKFRDQATVTKDILSLDVEKYEANIFSVKNICSKYHNSIKFMKTISRYNPDVCLLECYSFDLNEEWVAFKGLNLNLSCSNHQNALPMAAYMLFGGMTQRGDIN
jgi:hypothetical protein